MTIMRVSLVGCTLSDQQKEKMANRLIEAFAQVEVRTCDSRSVDE